MKRFKECRYKYKGGFLYYLIITKKGDPTFFPTFICSKLHFVLLYFPHSWILKNGSQF